MSKELEYIQRQIDIVKKQVKGSKMKIIVSDVITNHQYDYYENELQTLESIEQALLELQSIDNAEPSEALECLEDICKILNEKRIDVKWLFKNDYNTIKQALLKAQEQEAKFLDNLQRWFLLLGESGANTKYKVRDEMEAVIDELKEVLE